MSIYDCQLRHDPQGRIIEKTETVNGKAMTWTYAYDEEGRLTGARLDGRTVCDINYDREGYRVSDYFPHLDTHYRNYAYSAMDNRLQQAATTGTPTMKTDSGPSGIRAASTRSTSTRRTTGS